MTYYAHLESPLGPLLLAVDDDVLTTIRFEDGRHETAVNDGTEERAEHPILRAAGEQLEAYFAGGLEAFELPLAPRGTVFQQRVWQALGQIAYGHTMSYSDLAREIGKPGAARAVGAANGANPLPIVVPCHRVIGSDGSLTGYGGGMDRKRQLLALESHSVT